MSIETLIYLADVASGIKNWTITVSVASFIVSVLILVISAMQANEYNSDKTFNDAFLHNYNAVKNYLKAATVFLIIQTFIPGKETIYIMASASMAKQMTQSDEFKSIYNKSFQLLNKKIDEALAEKKK